MKNCSSCKQIKKIDEFYKRKTGKRVGETYEKCKDCYRNRGRKYYHQNRLRQSALALARKRRYKKVRRELIENIKRGKPCTDCGKVYPPWVMDFDHLDSTNKIGSISRMAVTNTSNLIKIRIEIAKCELVCANCHRQRTHDRIAKKFAKIANEVKAPL